MAKNCTGNSQELQMVLLCLQVPEDPENPPNLSVPWVPGVLVVPDLPESQEDLDLPEDLVALSHPAIILKYSPQSNHDFNFTCVPGFPASPGSPS